MHDLTCTRITIRGAVQGVGFRPFVYRLAKELHLNGWVSNSTDGVCIEAEGSIDALEQFRLRLGREHPPGAVIHRVEFSFSANRGFTDFRIRPSESGGTKRTLVLPDIAACADCLNEVFDPSNRRYRYPFTNCTNCGPRFTIIERLPYDRENTTMRAFAMCARCRTEYEDPLDRRFHAQPNACTECGPWLELWDEAGTLIAAREEALRLTVDALKQGGVVAVKGLGGFHLMVDAENEEAVRLLRRRKHREEKPFALMTPSLAGARTICVVDALEEGALSSPESPIVLLSRRPQTAIARSVAPGNPYLGVMLPSTPLHHILMREIDRPLVATSGNLSDEPIVTDQRDAIRRLNGIATLFLVHNRPIRRHADDSIVRIILGGAQILRRARGYAPIPAPAGGSGPATLAVGSHLKNTVALAVDRHCFVSQHIGDLETHEAAQAFQNAIRDFENMFDVRPELIAADPHRDYSSTAYALQLATRRSTPIRFVQHHWAHVLSCMAEHCIEGPVLGVAWDGAGYGPDGTLWGGEFLIAEHDRFRRAAHFRNFPLPGGDAAARKPGLAAAGLLYEAFGAPGLPAGTPPLVRQMLEKNIRSPKTSSVGRLFDAVAFLVGREADVSFEGQAAMMLEFSASADVEDHYPYAIRPGAPLIVNWEPMLRQILIDVNDGVAEGIVAARFHNALAEIVTEVAVLVGQDRVVLTGGCFQNRRLTERTVARLARRGFQAYWHRLVPPNDGGIALGQVTAARRMIQQENSCALQFQEKSLKSSTRTA